MSWKEGRVKSFAPYPPRFRKSQMAPRCDSLRLTDDNAPPPTNFSSNTIKYNLWHLVGEKVQSTTLATHHQALERQRIRWSSDCCAPIQPAKLWRAFDNRQYKSLVYEAVTYEQNLVVLKVSRTARVLPNLTQPTARPPTPAFCHAFSIPLTSSCNDF
jgi:hypothetical protein